MGDAPNRPDWLWEKWDDGSYVYWTLPKVELREYIDHLERENSNLRESTRIPKEMAEEARP